MRPFPLFDDSTAETPGKARQLTFSRCSVEHARGCNKRWHSRMPVTNVGPWQFAFSADFAGTTYAVAMWHNPSGRCLPSHWLELRRLAISPEAPKNTASRFMGWMVRYFKRTCPDRERCISYQDTAVHDGTIYRAAGWHIGYTSKRRNRDRSGLRAGTRRLYRWDANGRDVEAALKIRWEKEL